MGDIPGFVWIAWILCLLFNLSIIAFGIWAILKVMGHFGII